MEPRVTQTAISVDMIAAAEPLMGVTQTQPERPQMPDNLEGQITAAIQHWAVPMANSVPMAMRFDPRLPGFAMPYGANVLCLSAVTGPLPAKDEDFAFAPVTNPAT